MIDKFNETLQKLKEQGESQKIPKEEFSEAMQKMNASVQKTSEEFFTRQHLAWLRAKYVIVR